MQTEVTLNDENKSVIVLSGKRPNRLLFETQYEDFYDLIKTIPENKRLETIAFRAGYHLLGVHPEIKVGSHEYERYYKIKRGDVIVDAGAHVGIWTDIYANKVGPKGSVIAIEPDYRALGYLLQNTYRRKNITIVPYGLWDELDYIPFGVGSALGVSSYLYWITDKKRVEGEKSNYNYQLTKVDTLDHMLKDLNVDSVDFIKMDVEGAEVRALKGMTKTLESVKALAIASYHKTMENPNSTVFEVADFLKDLNFDVKVEFSDGDIVYANRSE